MVRLSSPRGITRIAAALAVLAAAACSGDATSPFARASQADALSSRSASHLHTGKYRDSGAPHATGRSGSARLAARALLGSDGVTRLLVTTGSIDDPDRAPGELAKVQLKVYGPDGTRLFTANYQRFTTGGSYEFRLTGLPHGARIEIQANVRGIDRNRTDVVNVTATIVSAPALVVSIDPPRQVLAGAPTVITGTVRETGGEAGTYTSCVLYVDGVEVDRIDDVWVDAGDAVTCAFTTDFREGTHQVEIRLERQLGDTALIGMLPSATGQVTAVTPNPQPTWTASVTDRTVQLDNRYEETWTRPDGMTRVHTQNTGEAPRTQSLSLAGSIARATTFPLATVDLDVWSDAGHWHSAVWSGLNAGAPDAKGRSCVDQLVPEQGAHFYLCSTGSGATGSTSFGYTRFAGTVTYHSVVFGRMWDEVAGQETLWNWNNVSETYSGGGQMRLLGTGVNVHLEITDAVGTIPVNAAVALSPFDATIALTPYACRDLFPYWLDGGLQRICEGSTQRTYGWSGEATG